MAASRRHIRPNSGILPRTRPRSDLRTHRSRKVWNVTRLSKIKSRLLIAVGTAVVAAASAVCLAAPSAATSASTSVSLPGGDTWQVNAWHCGTYWDKCSWTSSTKLLGSNPYNAQWISNRAELEAHGGSLSITLSKHPSATITFTSSSLGKVTWTNWTAWISDNAGVMDPSWSTAWVSTRSCGWGRVNSSIYVSEKCAYAGAF